MDPANGVAAYFKLQTFYCFAFGLVYLLRVGSNPISLDLYAKKMGTWTWQRTS